MLIFSSIATETWITHTASELILFFFEQKNNKQDTLFVQRHLPNGFTAFWSERKREGSMYLALKKSGAVKNATKTSLRHKSVHFTVILCSRRKGDDRC